ncbi:MAG: UDP-2,3-diacylglucosamine diphosphatase [Hydrogenophaga sp.]|nr:UDP-2,3-diacylglucosamine diphosphatase [Hydrogenophaga sp.]
MPTINRFATVHAPAHWQAVDFISDLHLQASEPDTAAAWRNYLSRPQGEKADALFILGDLFEVWIGDDELDDPHGFAAKCAGALRQYSVTTPIYFLCGNRDFLIGERALAGCGMSGLPDPAVLDFHGTRCLLSHGDELCLEDTTYQTFRALVRSDAWRSEFLARPMQERKVIARDLRQKSESRKQLIDDDPELWADVDARAASAWLSEAGATVLIHGHTHRPGTHELGNGCRREVLSDWDASAHPPRLEVLRLTRKGMRRLSLA